jgi:hypothetical protein
MHQKKIMNQKMKKKKDPNNILKKYLLVYIQSNSNQDELEIRFGTNYKNQITKIKFNNIIEKLKSLGFKNVFSEHYLNVTNEFVDTKSGRKKMSNIRTQIFGIHNIKKYCKNNTLDLENSITKKNYGFSTVKEIDTTQLQFLQKFRKKNADETFLPIDFNDFQFRVNYKTERLLKFDSELVTGLLNSWSDSKKVFRLIKRISFERDDLPFRIDLSIVKSSRKIGPRLVPEYNLETSNVLNNPETYEVELELIRSKTPTHIKDLEKQLKNGIKIILSALQKTNYPVSYREHNLVLQEYMRLIHKDVPDRKIYTSDFIGPSSISLEIIHIVQPKDEISFPNINTPYTVTEKADGSRNLMFISSIGKVYLINTNMEVIFTGCICRNKECFNSLLDGEHVERDKNNKYINYFLVFDIYYQNGRSVMEFPFVEMEGLAYTRKDMSKEIFRYKVLIQFLQSANFESVTSNPLPMVIKHKEFYKNTSKTIFAQCNAILSKVKEGGFPYETDGLIFTPINTGVSSDIIGETPPNRKITWKRSFKWKPPEFNSIDFLVTTKKDESGQDLITNEFTDGLNLSSQSQILKYKTLVLRVGFDERKHGFKNPCKNIIDDDLPSSNVRDQLGYRPVPFQPTNPTPEYPAYLCNIYLTDDNKMTIENSEDFFEDETIIEFRFEKTEKKFWQWKPIRVRNDKTTDYKKGLKNYGNAYHVANSVWKSIHSPVTERMIRTGQDIHDEIIDDDVYYNSSGNKTITRSLRDFHNLVVKRDLILGVSRRGNILIDQSVGKAGDFPKWKAAKLSFVFGIDYSKDNIENRMNGACARYLNEKMRYRVLPKVLYLHGDSSLNIRSGEAFHDQKSKQIVKAIFGQGTRDSKILGKGVHKQYGKGLNGFDIVSNQFSIHYFFENYIKINNFLRNVTECCKVGGYFIGTCYDGKRVFNQLRNKEVGEGLLIMQDTRKMWEITKNYSQTEFNDDESSLNCTISVYQESINKTFPEYLVNFDYLTRLIENYGFTPLTTDECKQLGFISSIGSFSLLYNKMNNKIKRGTDVSLFGSAPNLNPNEKKISFLNNYFIYKKRRPINGETVFNSLVKSGPEKKKKMKFKKLKSKIKLKFKK